jgi:TRAP-type C4-dicarboxylate transport system substrate-binding protein
MPRLTTPLVRRTMLQVLASAAMLTPAVAAVAWKEWTLFSSQPRSEPAPMATIRRLAEEMPRRSAQALYIEVKAAGSLPIRSTTVTAAVALDKVQMGDDLYFTSAMPAAGSLRLPGLIVSDHDLRDALPIQRALLDSLFAKHKAMLLGYYVTPPQVIFAVRQVAGIDDLRGMVIRTTSQEQAEVVYRLGALATTMVAEDVPAALEAGTLHGVFGTAVNAGKLWPGLLAFGCRIAPVRGDGVILVNRAEFAALSQPVAGAVVIFGADLAAAVTQDLAAAEATAMAELTSGGFKMADPRPDDLIAAARRLTPFWEAITSARGKDASDTLAALRLALGR